MELEKFYANEVILRINLSKFENFNANEVLIL